MESRHLDAGGKFPAPALEIPLQMYSFVFYSNLYEVDCSEHASPRFIPSLMCPFLKDTLFKMLTEW